MIFTIIYHNDSNLRKQISEMLLSMLRNGFDFAKQPVRTPLFFARPTFLSLEELEEVPLAMQVEELEFSENRLISKKILTIDVQTV